MIDAKVSSSVRKMHSEATLQMSKLSKKVRGLEKHQVEKDDAITSNEDKIDANKKIAHDIKRKGQLVKRQQGSSKRVNFQYQQQHVHVCQNGSCTREHNMVGKC